MKNLRWNKDALYRNAVLALILLCVALIVHEIFGQHGFLALRHQQKQVEALQQQIQQLRKENEELDRQIKALRTDPKAIERLAREQMRMARPGDLIYALPEKQPSKGQPSPAKENPPR
jgi:cell division protein FtsB